MIKTVSLSANSGTLKHVKVTRVNLATVVPAYVVKECAFPVVIRVFPSVTEVDDNFEKFPHCESTSLYLTTHTGKLAT